MELKEKLEYIGRRIKLVRVAKGLRQVEVAKSLGVSQAHLSNIEKGRNRVTLEILLKLQALLGCPISEFFCDIDERQKKPEASTSDLQALLKLVKALKENK